MEVATLWIDRTLLGQFREDDVGTVVIGADIDARYDIVRFTSEKGLASETVFRVARDDEVIAACVDVSTLTNFVNLRRCSYEQEGALAGSAGYATVRNITSQHRCDYSNEG